jgi:formylmethanofuran dehydrogenase subunit E
MGYLNFELLLKESASIHGHLCPGQVLGVKMSILGLRKIGIEEPRGKDRKNVIVFVEIDRCATDAIQSVTGCTLGRRTMRFLDYGKMAATFLNLKTGKAVRLTGRDDAREKARLYQCGTDNRYAAQVQAYRAMSDEELFDTMEVDIRLRPEDMPGMQTKRVRCELCGESVQDMRKVLKEGKVMCRPCAGGAYYATPRNALPGVMQTSHSGMEIRSKLWIEIDGEPVFGRGRRFLLEAIAAHGSINQAAKVVNISYRKAWSYLKAMEERLGIPLVERRTGGKHGGGAVLTEDAREFLKKFEELDEGVRGIVDERFRRVFPPFGEENTRV